MPETVVPTALPLWVVVFFCAAISAGVAGKKWPTFVSLGSALFLVAIIVMLGIGIKISSGFILAVGGGTFALSAVIVIVHFAIRRSQTLKEKSPNDSQHQA